MKQKTESKPRQVIPYYFAILFAGLVVFSLTILTPLGGLLPVEITEQVKVVGITEKGVVVETSRGVPVIIGHSEAQLGELIEVTYTVPVQYLESFEKAEKRLAAITP